MYRLDRWVRLRFFGVNHDKDGLAKAAREHEVLTLSAGLLMRISVVLGIHQALQLLFGSERDGIAWLHRPHAATVFAGSPPIDWIVSGTQDGLTAVRRFLDGARGGIYMQTNAVDRDFAPYTDEEILFL